MTPTAVAKNSAIQSGASTAGRMKRMRVLPVFWATKTASSTSNSTPATTRGLGRRRSLSFANHPSSVGPGMISSAGTRP